MEAPKFERYSRRGGRSHRPGGPKTRSWPPGFCKRWIRLPRVLKSEAPDTQTLSDTFHRTALLSIKARLRSGKENCGPGPDGRPYLLYNGRGRFLALAGQAVRVAAPEAQAGLYLSLPTSTILKESTDTLRASGGRPGHRSCGRML